MTIRFGHFTLDECSRQLLRGTAPVHLSPKAFDLLALLARERPAAKSKDDIHHHLWPDTFVSDVNLAVLITEIRDALQDNAHRPIFVRTLHRFGYAFCGSAVETDVAPLSHSVSDVCCLTWGTSRATLAAGPNTLGREPSADIRIDAAGVSRRHALIVVLDEEVTLEDLGSKNGTFVNGARVTGPTRLGDGTEFQIGSIPITFRRISSVTSTQSLDGVVATG